MNAIDGSRMRLQIPASAAESTQVNVTLMVVREGPPPRPVVGLQEGQRVVWEGGETRNITAVLNERLHDHRHAP
jgi:hypothetical protein